MARVENFLPIASEALSDIEVNLLESWNGCSSLKAMMVGTEGKPDMPQFEYWTNRWNNGDTSWQLDGVYP
ncbi:hypothetical protein HPB47_010988 [Ixodes persulcatus]|uniref:Uncharacterized protein n=1 Tax=Ixodes persulcatus TaxID=34615 RepID=A0AC60NXI6_IXOPE|nr:hypothetical protein HPB47_010988 [Ixodes persulcatus]